MISMFYIYNKKEAIKFLRKFSINGQEGRARLTPKKCAIISCNRNQ